MNTKTATTKYKVTELIKERWSPRSFSDKIISIDDLNTLFEAASWAFSSGNVQPWYYIYAHRENKEAFEKLHKCLNPGNQPWTAHAAVLMAILVRTKLENGKENKAAKHDVGAANATLALQATSMGISCHPMIGFDPAKTIETLAINAAEIEPLVFVALGYQDVPEKLEEPFRSRETEPRSRKGLTEFTKQLL
ncbi:MAG TPA: nitroreductase family protein [Bacteroidia bacterium]|jgi:nitroreductase|nr:nitroreductase family protein [Bacteroidia bacterium]